MNEIGKARTVVVKTVQVINGKRTLIPKVSSQGEPETCVKSAEIWRVTREELDGTFGRDHGRKLVVGLILPDLLVLYPKGTRQKVTLPLDEVYRIALMRKANINHMTEMRERKAKRQEQREQRRLDAAERRLRRPAKEDSWAAYTK
jgi:hypothetical protein